MLALTCLQGERGRDKSKKTQSKDKITDIVMVTRLTKTSWKCLPNAIKNTWTAAMNSISKIIWWKEETNTHFNGRSRLFDPGYIETASNKGVGVSHLLDDLAGGLASAMTWLCVHKDEKRICLLGAAAYGVLQRGNVLEGVERHHPVIVISCQQEHCRILDPVTFWDADVMEWGVPGKEEQMDGTEFRY